MKDSTYAILSKLLVGSFSENELIKYTDELNSVRSLEYRHLIEQGVKEDGSPDGIYSVTEEGLEYIRSELRERRNFRREFFSQFVSGLIVGILTTVVGVSVLQLITSILAG